MRKSTDDKRSLAKQIDNLDTWIGREQKGIENLAKDLEEAMVALGQRRSDLETEITKLATLKAEMLNEEKKEDTGMKVDGNTPETEAEAHALQEKELNLRRQTARKRNMDGKSLSAKQLKEMEAEATLICENLEKRRKVNICAGS